MRKTLLVLLCLGIGLFSSSGSADDIQIGIATGGEKGTYYQFGQDMSRLLSQHGIALNVLSSRGSFENMVAIYDSPDVQLGLAQSDVVLFMKLLGDSKLQDLAEEIKVVFPLYNEEVHLLATGEIKMFEDLAGKKIAVGKAGSGTAMTATLLLGTAQVQPSEVLEIGGNDAIQRLRKGEIDAMFFVAGYPVKLFQDGITKNDRIHLLPITNKKIIDLYGTTAVIPAGTYAWQEKDVPTIDITAGLMTRDYKGDNVNCGYVGQAARLVRDNLSWLKENGHEKWKSVDLEAPVAESLQSACAVQDS